MKHILKVASLQNLPNTRPLVAMSENGNLFCEGAPEEPAIGDILYSDMSYSSKYNSSKTPIAVRVALASDFSDNKSRWVSLVNMSAIDPEHGTTSLATDLTNPGAGICFGCNTRDIASLTNQTSRDTAVTDINGKSNTQKIIAKTTKYLTGEIVRDDHSEGSYPAPTACYRFYTEGTSPHDWYLPSAGELSYIDINKDKINNSLESLGNLAVKFTSSYDDKQYVIKCPSSTEYNSAKVWWLELGIVITPRITSDYKQTTISSGIYSKVRAFLQY